MATEPTGGPATPLITRVKNILLQPRSEWARIDGEPATIGGIYRSYVLILAAIPAVAGLIGALLFGYSFLVVSVRPSVGAAVSAAVVGYLMSLASVYVLALIIEALAPTFGGTKDRVQAFKVAAYSYTAVWVAGILMILPSLAMIASLLGLYSLYLLYVGLPILMKVSAERAVGYVAAVIVAAIVVFIIVGTITSTIMSSLMPAPDPGSIRFTLPG